MLKQACKLLTLLLLASISLLNAGQHVHKYVLENGLTLLVRPVKTTQNVSTQIWYNVGSKHEADDEKGLAHWLEHMCFKGTDKLSETDIRLTCAKLSGSFNADTSYDRTRYYLDFPAQHWFEALPILADMMTNCTFKQDLLNAELQVVIQEMKNGKDNYGAQVFQSLLASIFPDHPYHYPVIGYKSDLASLSREKLVNFYKKHYIPNNALLVVVGNVDPDDVLKRVTKEFGNIKPDLSYTHKEYSFQEDICAKSVTLYRNIQKPVVFLTHSAPGLKKYIHNSLEILASILTGSQSSRLYKKLVEGQELVYSINTGAWSLHDSRIVYIAFEPKRMEDIEAITESIQQELTLLEIEGPTEEEVTKVLATQDANFYDLLERNHAQADAIAACYLATGSEDKLFEVECHDFQEIKIEMQSFIKKYLRPAVRHKGLLLPIPESEQPFWKELQEKSNQEDLMLMQNKARQSAVEKGKYVHTITAQEASAISVPVPQEHVLSNGLKVLYYHNDNTPKIEITLDLKFGSSYEPKGKEPLCSIHNALLLEGTKNYPKEELLAQIQKKGINITLTPGRYHANTLNKEALATFEFLTEIITNPLFEESKIAKHKTLALSHYTNYWDSPSAIMRYLMGKHLYDNAGFFLEPVGTPESIASITVNDIKNFHAKHMTPQEATIVIVGDLTGIDLIDMLEKTIGAWQGPKLATRNYFTEKVAKSETEITYHIDREQVMLGFIGLSVNAQHPDYDALQLFNIVFNKKLFELREKSNAFYWINGSVNAGAGKIEPGEVFIKTQVSQTRVEEAQELILNTIDTIADEFSEEDLLHCHQVYANELNNIYSTNASIVSSFVSLNSWQWPYDYYVTHAQDIKKITVQEVRDAVKRVLNRENLTVFKVGPIH